MAEVAKVQSRFSAVFGEAREVQSLYVEQTTTTPNVVPSLTRSTRVSCLNGGLESRVYSQSRLVSDPDEFSPMDAECGFAHLDPLAFAPLANSITSDIL